MIKQMAQGYLRSLATGVIEAVSSDAGISEDEAFELMQGAHKAATDGALAWLSENGYPTIRSESEGGGFGSISGNVLSGTFFVIAAQILDQAKDDSAE